MEPGLGFELGRLWYNVDHGRGTVEETPLVTLLREMGRAAAVRGLVLHRWETASPYSAWVRTVRYVLHPANEPRPMRSSLAHGPGIEIRGPEGRTSRCRAYRQLQRLQHWL